MKGEGMWVCCHSERTACLGLEAAGWKGGDMSNRRISATIPVGNPHSKSGFESSRF